MPVRESEAIILRTYPLGEGDRLVSFFSRSEGRMRGVARGARKPKSRFGASLEPLSYVRTAFYERETRQLVRISQCELIESFWDAQRSYNVSLAFGFLAEICEAVLPEHEPSDPSFRLLLGTCRVIAKTGLIALPVAYFAAWTLRLGGWLPSLDRCPGCHRRLEGQEVWVTVDGSGIFCRDCHPGQARPISADGAGIIRRMLRESLDALANSNGVRVPPALANLMIDLVENQMEMKSNVRRILELTP
jgi:DNA repair protein RecO (recombination protein O)